MLANFEAWIHRLRRRFSRSEWAIRHLGLTPSAGTGEEPGLLLIQIDGLARAQLERAIAKGRMPFLRRLQQRNGYELHTFYPGLPSTTPAVQAELYYGVRSAVPAFSFFDRELKVMGRMWDPEWAKAREAACARHGEGLLKGGSSWSNIYTGGAGQEESHFCAASIGFGDMWRTGKIRNIFVFILLNLTAAIRILGLLLMELGVALADAVRAVLRGRRPGLELMLLLSRVFVGVGLRELLTISGQVDVARGLPIVHLNFVGYDEQSHQRGPGARLSHFGLRGIDTAIRRLWRAAHRSTRRDYAVWIFSDHGQETTRPFPPESPGGIETVLRACLDESWRRDPAWRARSQRRPTNAWLSRGRRSEARRERERRAGHLTEEEQKTFSVTAMGPVGHVYFAEPKTGEQRLAFARRLVGAGRVPGVLVREEGGRTTWIHARGETAVPEEVPALLPHPPAIRREIARDLVDFCANPNCGDLILLAWSPWDQPWSFADEHGGHGGFGPAETQGFVLLPAHTRLPAGTADFIRPSALRTAARHFLGRERLGGRPARSEGEPRLRLMTYNVHGCSGMDGRISPRRVARAIARHQPDVVALQELDLGRRRSRAEDQAAIIAEELGMQAVFCPTETVGSEHYGHALLSRGPVEVVRRALLPRDPRSWWQEARAALWARVQLDGRFLHILTTHLGLGARERAAQMRALLAEDWIGGIPPDEPVILCGDLNSLPRSTPYRLAAQRLRDAQAGAGGRRPLGTFTSARPVMRLDHVFLSPHFETLAVTVPRSDLTRVASDHLPLLVDLRVVAATADKSTTKRRAAAPSS
ncbi:MAG TPA: endonuclease/exonuclease/phosphatase family protein [Opitutaceae bacterium]|nr:endonuclease/exonuclease/phosphatase family protein [Opitutaceae bacterium]